MGHNSDGKINDSGICFCMARTSSTAPLILFYFGQQGSLPILAGQSRAIHLGSNTASSRSATTCTSFWKRAANVCEQPWRSSAAGRCSCQLSPLVSDVVLDRCCPVCSFISLIREREWGGCFLMQTWSTCWRMAQVAELRDDVVMQWRNVMR